MMKNKKTFFKSALACIIIIATVFTLSACGGTPKASDANGTAGTLNWNYTASDKTLTISGSGDIPTFATADDVAWINVRTSVETVKFVGSASGGVTSIGDHAFYLMTNLKTVEIPASVTKIGKSAFAFCSKLENVIIPTGVVTIAERAFEGCSALKAISVPASVTSIGQSAFAYCNALTDISILGKIALPAYVFRNCKSLVNLNAADGVTADATAFDGAAKNLDTANKIGAEGTITVKYVLEDGKTNAFAESQDRSEVKKLGEEYSYTSPDKEGYAPDQAVVSGVSAGIDKEIIVKYTKKAEETTAATQAETQPSAETGAASDSEEKGGITPSTIIAIVIMGVVLIAIVVGAILLMRSDKSNKKNNSKNTKK